MGIVNLPLVAFNRVHSEYSPQPCWCGVEGNARYGAETFDSGGAGYSMAWTAKVLIGKLESALGTLNRPATAASGLSIWYQVQTSTTNTHGDWRAARRGGDQTGISLGVQSPAVLVLVRIRRSIKRAGSKVADSPHNW